MNFTEGLDVVIVGAGAAGVGCGIVLRDVGIQNFVILERHEVGASFSRWPEEMRFITPSFPSHGFGLLDLNAIALGTSPAYNLKREHLSGKEYALYLQTAVDYFQLPVQTKIDVQAVEPLPQGKGFILKTSKGKLHTRFVIWAAGEFQYPNLNPFPKAQLCIHNSQVRSWKDLPGDEFIIIGGYESGIDAATSLHALGKRVRVLDRSGRWANMDYDPSISLSPYTLNRLESVYNSSGMELISNAAVESVQRTDKGYVVYSEYHSWISPTPPILCTGFKGSISLITNLFDWSNGHAALTHEDESTITPGLFLVGPGVRHGNVIFCFIYKFRQRFAVVVNALAQRLGLDTTPLEGYRQAGLFLDDLSCCDNECVC